MRSNIFWCALGFFAGAVAMDCLAARASRSYLRLVRAQQQIEHDALGVCARRRGDVDAAVVHFTSATAAASDEAGAWRDLEASWNVGFPLWSAIFELLVGRPELRSDRVAEAVSRAALARALEHADRSIEADAEYARAARLLGRADDRAAMRRLAEGMEEAQLTGLDRRFAKACYFSRTAGTAGVGASSIIR